MAISKKPVKEKVDVEALILKGGSVPTASSPTPPPPPALRKAESAPAAETDGRKVSMQLRLSPEIVQEIDGLIERRVIRIPRHAWFMEAIAEKIVRERL